MSKEKFLPLLLFQDCCIACNIPKVLQVLGSSRYLRFLKQLIFYLHLGGGATILAILNYKSISITGNGDRNIKCSCIFQSLLQSGTDCMFIIFCFYDSYRNIRLVIDDDIGTFLLTTFSQFSFYKNTTSSKGYFFSDLGLFIPSRSFN